MKLEGTSNRYVLAQSFFILITNSLPDASNGFVETLRIAVRGEPEYG